MFYSVNEQQLEEQVIKRKPSCDMKTQKIDSDINQSIDKSQHDSDKSGSLTNIEVAQSSVHKLPPGLLCLSDKNHTSLTNIDDEDSFSSEKEGNLENKAMLSMLNDFELRRSLQRKGYVSSIRSEKIPIDDGSEDSDNPLKMNQKSNESLEQDKNRNKLLAGKMIKTGSYGNIGTDKRDEFRCSSKESIRLLRVVESSIASFRKIPGKEKKCKTNRKLCFLIALFFLVGVSFLLTIFSQQVASRSKFGNEPEVSKDSPTQQDKKANGDTTPTTVYNDFNTAHQIVLTCIEKSDTATKSCGEMCASKRCCFEEFDCLAVMTQQECSVYAGCLGWLLEERYIYEQNQIKKVVNELMNKPKKGQKNTTKVWIDSGGRKFSANLLQEACNENNIKTQYGRDNCSYLCHQHKCCFISSSLKSCSSEKERCQVFSPCEKVFV